MKKRDERVVCESIHDQAVTLNTGLNLPRYPEVLVVACVLLLLNKAAEYCPDEFLSEYDICKNIRVPSSKALALVSLRNLSKHLIEAFEVGEMNKELVSRKVAEMLLTTQCWFPVYIDELRKMATCEMNESTKASLDRFIDKFMQSEGK